jgi:hypothetical protein
MYFENQCKLFVSTQIKKNFAPMSTSKIVFFLTFSTIDFTLRLKTAKIQSLTKSATLALE